MSSVVPIKKRDRKTPVLESDTVSTRELARAAAFASNAAMDSVEELAVEVSRNTTSIEDMKESIEKQGEGLFQTIGDNGTLDKRVKALEDAVGQAPDPSKTLRDSFTDRTPEEIAQSENGTGLRGDMHRVMLILGTMTRDHKRSLAMWGLISTTTVAIIEILSKVLLK